MKDEDPLRLYVARCIDLGYSKQRIRDRLIEAGYTMPDVDTVLESTHEPFRATPTTANSERVLLIAGVLVFVLIAASSLLWLRDTPALNVLPATPSPTLQPVAPEVNVPAPVAAVDPPIVNPAALPSIPARVGWPIRPSREAVSAPPAAPYCSNYECLIAAVTACTPRQFIVNAPLDVENLSINTTITMTLGGATTGGCTLWFVHSYQKIQFYEEYAGELLSLGLTSSQIDLLEAEANQAAAAAMPARSSCALKSDVLRTLFAAWSVGSYTTKPLIDAGCPVAYG